MWLLRVASSERARRDRSNNSSTNSVGSDYEPLMWSLKKLCLNQKVLFRHSVVWLNILAAKG